MRGDGGSPLYLAVDIKPHALTRLRSTRTSETWDMSLSRSFITPTTNFSASNTSNSDELDVGTFCLNQYKHHVL